MIVICYCFRVNLYPHFCKGCAKGCFRCQIVEGFSDKIKNSVSKRCQSCHERSKKQETLLRLSKSAKSPYKIAPGKSDKTLINKVLRPKFALKSTVPVSRFTTAPESSYRGQSSQTPSNLGFVICLMSFPFARRECSFSSLLCRTKIVITPQSSKY